MPGENDWAVDRPLVHVATRLNAPLQVRVEGEPKTDEASITSASSSAISRT